MIPDKIKRNEHFRRGFHSGYGAGKKAAAKVKPRKVAELLNEILDHQIANRHCDPARYTPHYKCYTYNTGDMPAWVAKAEKMLAEFK